VSSGDELWAATAGEYLGGYQYGIGTSSDGARVYVTGGISDVIDTRAYDTSSGAIVWVGRHLRDGGYWFDRGTRMTSRWPRMVVCTSPGEATSPW
jgi:hypothetical protein